MRYLGTALLVQLAICLPTKTASTADTSKPSDELRVLEDLVGTWDEVMTNQPTEWAPRAERSTAVTKRSWGLGGKIIQAQGTWKPAQSTFLHLMSYDPESKAYRSWYFDAQGSMPRASTTGTWDAKSRTIRWTSVDEKGNQTVGTHRIIDKDHSEWTMMVKNPNGKIVLDFAGKCTRHKG